jgi:single-stranded-DNA-specific exonuclease
VDEAAAQELAQHLGCPLPIARILLSRGIADHAAAQAFLHPTLDQLHDPHLLRGMAAAVDRIQQAVRNAEPILIYGDYDVDGTTATVLLKTAIELTSSRLAPPGKPTQVTYHVPHRLREGYGMQTNVLGIAAGSGIRLVISVDTGIRAFAAADEARTLGLDLIVTDHHLPDDAGIPHAVAVINPNQPGCPYPNKNLCGAGVAFKLAHAILLATATSQDERDRLRNRLIPSFLKLVAIATIADSVPLQGENRAIACLGLHELRNPVQPGLRALMQIAQIPLDRPPTATEVGFRLAPRINAAGRMDIASDVVELFLTRDPAYATALAEKLNQLNEDRRATEAEALESIETQLASLLNSHPGDEAEPAGHAESYPPQCIILDDPLWHRGVLGILASRVVDRTKRPALILTHEGGQAHGSGRSIEGFHLLDALTSVHTPTTDATPLFTRFGGHAHAVGFSLPSENLALLRSRFESYQISFLTPTVLRPILACDAKIRLSDITQELVRWLAFCAPFGIGNPEPVFFSTHLVLAATPRIIKDKHIRLTLRTESEPARFEALGWGRQIDWPERCRQLQLHPGSVVDIAFRLKEKSNPRFPGLEMELIDLWPARTLTSKL